MPDEYEFKQLKQRTRTGEAEIKSTKDGFSYFDLFDEVMGHRDSVDSSKMAIEVAQPLQVAKVVLPVQLQMKPESQRIVQLRKLLPRPQTSGKKERQTKRVDVR